MTTIVVGVDGSEDARRALAWAVWLATALDAEIVAVHARGLLERLRAGPADRAHREGDEVRARFEHDWCRVLDRDDVRSRRLVREGDPVIVLLDVARDVGADLIVVGRRGIGAAAGVVGSTSAQVTRDSVRPVVVVPPTDHR